VDMTQNKIQCFMLSKNKSDFIKKLNIKYKTIIETSFYLTNINNFTTIIFTIMPNILER
jgi:hypothetical protein